MNSRNWGYKKKPYYKKKKYNNNNNEESEMPKTKSQIKYEKMYERIVQKMQKIKDSELNSS